VTKNSANKQNQNITGNEQSTSFTRGLQPVCCTRAHYSL